MLFIVVFLIALVIGGTASQAYCQKVEVEQNFLDSCNKAFVLIPELRKQLANYAEKEKLTEAERKASLATIAALDSLMVIKDRTITSYEQLVATLQRVVQIQTSIIDQLEKRLLKPKSFIEKFLKGLERIAIITAGILIGKGL